MANAAQVLQQAHDLIEAGDYQAARQILDTVRSSNENNPDFWWVYAHAVEDAAEGKAAIERVRQLAPNYSGLETITGGSPQASGIKPLRPLAPPPPMGKTEEEDEFAETGKEARQPNRFMPVLGAMLLVLLIVGVLIVSLSQFLGISGPTPTPEPTDIIDDFTTPIATSDSQVVSSEESPTQETVEVPTETEEAAETEESPTQGIVESEEPTETEEIAETEEEPTQEGAETEEPVPTEDIVETEDVVETEEPVATEDALLEVMDELESFGVPEEGIVEEESSLGQSLSITTCSTPGPVANQNIIGILNAMRDAGVELEVEALVFHISDCSTDDIILSLGISAEIVESYWLGDTTASELLAALRRV